MVIVIVEVCCYGCVLRAKVALRHAIFWRTAQNNELDQSKIQKRIRYLCTAPENGTSRIKVRELKERKVSVCKF